MSIVNIGKYHVSIAAEALAAAQFARLGFDVSVQYGANQPEYDLLITRDNKFLKISVKGSQDGGWGLTHNIIENKDYHDAADVWAAKHTKFTLLCLVQFYGRAYSEMPSVYLATPKEVAEALKVARGGLGDTTLNENHTWGANAIAKNTTDQIPADWQLTEERVASILANLYI